MAVFKRGRVWWYKFTWRGQEIRETTRQGNKRIAEQMEAARKTGLAKGEAGIRQKEPPPDVRTFINERFLPYVRTRYSERPKTIAFYGHCAGMLLGFRPLAKCRLDEVSPEVVSAFVAECKAAGMAIASTNRYLATLRRALRWGEELGVIEKAPLRVRLLPGEVRRERVLTNDEEARYFSGAVAVGQHSIEAYERALTGTRALERNQTPAPPADPFMLRDAATVLAECGLRPDELFRLRWSEYRDGALHIAHGKTKSARRSIPVTARVAAVLEMRKQVSGSEWVFPAKTKSGHIDSSSLKIQHRKACAIGQVPFFPLYTFRHTCLTRWSAHVDPYTLGYLAGHADFATTRRYVHPKGEQVLEALERARIAQGGYCRGHINEKATADLGSTIASIN